MKLPMIQAYIVIFSLALNHQIVIGSGVTFQERTKVIADDASSSKHDSPKPANTLIRRNMQSASSSSSSSSSSSTTTNYYGGGGGGPASEEECDDLLGCYEYCFSSHTTVRIMGKGNIQMNEIEVGDKVLTSKGNYETIYAIDHRHPNKLANFIQIFHSVSEEPLELTKKHMLFVEGNPNPIPAKNIKVGDQVLTLDGASTVRKVSTINRKGVFNPLTSDGTIFAGGILSSTYSAYFSDDEWIEVAGQRVTTHHHFFDMALKPYRYMCNGISLEFCKTNNEKIAISQWGENVYKYWSQQEAYFQTIILSLCIMIVGAFHIIFSPYFAAIMISRWIVTKSSSQPKCVK